MPTSLIVLEYIKVVLSWPVVVVFLSMIFMWTFRAAINALIGRVTGIVFPGGKVDAPQYQPEVENDKALSAPQLSKTEKVSSLITEHISNRMLGIEKDLGEFFAYKLHANLANIEYFLDILWSKSGNACFSGKTRPASAIETIKTLSGLIDPRVIEDVEYILGVFNLYSKSRQMNRSNFLTAIKKSEAIIDYLRRLARLK